MEIIFTYAPAGLGHLRVTDALYDGLPKGVKAIILSSHDYAITLLHRLSSSSIFGRKIMEYFQYGYLEELFTSVYRFILRKSAGKIYRELSTLIEQSVVKSKTVLIVSTHFSLAHQIASIKDKLAKEKNVRIMLVVQVTDDSPQKIWYVEGADLIVVPSYYTKKELEKYAANACLKPVLIVVAAYPVNPSLAIASDKVYRQRSMSLDPTSDSVCHVAVPISGAAVGLGFLSALIESMHRLEPRLKFHVVSKDVSFTQTFLLSMQNKPYAHLDVMKTDREVVDDYEKVYSDHVISLEITKPSEQAFKALLPYDRIGGSILLFTEPVGRQERDNLAFLEHHGLIPTQEETDSLLGMVLDGSITPHQKAPTSCLKMKVPNHNAFGAGFRSAPYLDSNATNSCWRSFTDETIKSELCPLISGYRGLRIPADPSVAAKFISAFFRKGVFFHMVSCPQKKPVTVKKSSELGPDGVSQFWEKVGERLKSSTVL